LICGIAVSASLGSGGGVSGMRTVARQYGQARLLPHKLSETFRALPQLGQGILKKIAIEPATELFSVISCEAG
jgi:hypothetical protein